MIDTRTDIDGAGQAAALRGFGPLGILAVFVILIGGLVPPTGALLVLVWVQLSRTPWREIGYVRPKNWIRTIAVGTVFGVAFKLLLKTVVMPLFGADPINQAYHFLAGNRAAIPGFLFTLFVNAGFAEETFYRGYLFERLGKLFGYSTVARVATVLLTTILFALAHYPTMGRSGVEQAIITGLVFGSIYMRTKQIVFPMVAHLAFDLAAYAIIYWNLEPVMAHVFFH